MLIVSQDKTEVHNLENIVLKAQENNVCAVYVASNVDVFIAPLGTYETEERAKEVLQEIVKEYSTCLYCQGGKDAITGEVFQTGIWNKPKVYIMPKE